MAVTLNKTWLTLEEVANYLCFSKEKVYLLIKQGQIPAIKVGRHWRFNKDQIDEWLLNLGKTIKSIPQKNQNQRKEDPNLFIDINNENILISNELDENKVKESFTRNIGVITREQQKILNISTIALAGAGADGGLTAERLARMGIGRIKIADPGYFDESNLNRQFGSDIDSIGKNKAEVVGAYLKKINPNIIIDIYKDGVNENNVEEFIAESDIVIDEIEYTRFDLSVLLHRQARKMKKNVFLGLNIAWGANLFIFSPDGITLEEYCGIHKDATLDEIRGYNLPLDRFCPNMPEYIANHVIQDVLGGKDIPSVSPACALLSSLVSTEVVLSLIKKRRSMPIVPKYISIDFYKRELYVGNNS